MPHPARPRDDRRRWLRHWRSERESAALFEALAEIERRPRDAGLYRLLATTERRHAEQWAGRLRAAGLEPPPFVPARRTRVLAGLARRLDPAVVLPLLARGEARDAGRYAAGTAEGPAEVAAQERANADLLQRHAQTETAEYLKKLLLLFRRWVILGVGAALFASAVVLARNVQLEGLFFGLAAGALVGPVLHYLLAKVLVPLPLGRVWCGWACWTAAVLDQLPYRTSEGWLPGPARRGRILHFGASLGLVAGLVAAGYGGGLYGASGVAWFVAGNLAYWALGIALAVRLRDNRAFCKYLCPVSVPLRLTARVALLKVAGDPEACATCAGQPCTTLCPMDIRIPDYVAEGRRVCSSECILCQHCVAVCPPNALRLTAGIDLSRRDRLQLRTE